MIGETTCDGKEKAYELFAHFKPTFVPKGLEQNLGRGRDQKDPGSEIPYRRALCARGARRPPCPKQPPCGIDGRIPVVRSRWPLALLLVAGMTVPGCSRYIRNRGKDFLDIFKLQVGVGWIAGVHVRASQFVSTGAALPFDKTLRVGLEGRRFVATVSEHRGCLLAPLARLVLTPLGLGKGRTFDYRDFVTDWALRREAGGEAGKLLAASGAILFFDALSIPAARHILAGAIARRRLPVTFLDRKLVHLLDLEASATVLPASVLVGVSPGELADFVLGWTTLDIAGDD